MKIYFQLGDNWSTNTKTMLVSVFNEDMQKKYAKNSLNIVEFALKLCEYESK